MVKELSINFMLQTFEPDNYGWIRAKFYNAEQDGIEAVSVKIVFTHFDMQAPISVDELSLRICHNSCE